ncbi:MAG TPA: glycosyltransferase [Thermoanaerobaculia bacterium]|nr:glycosyltransferase [Thermoanaerobaculia bacterium]
MLLATFALAKRYGTDLYTRDLALALLRQGLRPVVFTTNPGPLADEIRRATIPVVDDLEQLGVAPDVIHGHHNLETIAALLRFPGVPALFVCHDALAWHSIPPLLPRIGAYVAVDDNCRDRMLLEHAIPEDRVRVLANAVELQRFARRPPLPEKPKRALVFSNAAREYTFIPAIRDACARRGIEVDVAGAGSGKATDAPESLLPRYDLVFAKARCALEAMAVGTAVILCDARGLGTLVTSDSVDALRRLNFGARTLQRDTTADAIGAEIDRYDAADAAKVCTAIRSSAGVELLASQFIAIYDELRAMPAADDDPIALSRFLAKLPARIDPPAAASVPMRERILTNRALAPALRLLYKLMK